MNEIIKTSAAFRLGITPPLLSALQSVLQKATVALIRLTKDNIRGMHMLNPFAKTPSVVPVYSV